MQPAQMISRRMFLRSATAAGLGLAAGIRGRARTSGKLYAYVSSWTSGPSGAGGEGGIHVFAVDPNEGSLQHLSSVYSGGERRLICISPNGRYLYSTDERTDFGHQKGAGGGIVAFSIDPRDGHLTKLNAVPSMGSFPAYISIDQSGSRLLAANHGGYEPVTEIVPDGAGTRVHILYDDSSVSLFAAGADGIAPKPTDVKVMERPHASDPADTGIAAMFRASAHAHSVNFVPQSPFALVCDKGMDRVYVYRVDESRLEKVFAYDAPPRSARDTLHSIPRCPMSSSSMNWKQASPR